MSAGDGGAIWANDDATVGLNGVVFSDCVAGGSGGAIAAVDARLEALGCQYLNCEAAINGGGVAWWNLRCYGDHHIDIEGSLGPLAQVTLPSRPCVVALLAHSVSGELRVFRNPAGGSSFSPLYRRYFGWRAVLWRGVRCPKLCYSCACTILRRPGWCWRRWGTGGVGGWDDSSSSEQHV
mmetsp:Transcript_52940/g.139448  ORF Transcript_52940/g.139448 Transcript_52940/m.139448 type:complete len:180 (+) Transcript_52940:2461-3000(+)